MSIIELLLVAVGLAMDAFAVSVSKGLTLKKFEWNKGILCGIYFGLFQALMPVLGYFLGYGFRDAIENIDHWIAFIVLSAIGISMIRGAGDETGVKDGFDFKTMIILAIATSIDALAVGVSFAFLRVNIWMAALMIGVSTFVIATAGAKIGSVFGSKFKSKAEIAGGVILILIGIRILASHLGVI